MADQKIDLNLAAIFQWALAEQKKLESVWWGSNSYTPTVTDIFLARLLVAELDNQPVPMKISTAKLDPDNPVRVASWPDEPEKP